MAIGTGVTEIADSEEEPLTSSPVGVSDAAVNELSQKACQEAQAVACHHQEVAAHTVNSASDYAGVLDDDQVEPSTYVNRNHIDQLELHPNHKTATNNADTCTVKTARQESTSVQGVVLAVVRAEQANRMMTNTTDDEARSPPAKWISTEVTPDPSSDESATLQMRQQNSLLESEKNHLLPFQEREFNVSDSTSVQQDDTSEDVTYGLPVDAHNAGSRSMQSGSTPPTDRERESTGPGNFSTVSQEDSAAAAIGALATKHGCDIPREATIETSNATSVHNTEAAGVDSTAPDTVTEMDSIDLEPLPGIVDIALTGGTSRQHTPATELSVPKNTSTSMSSGEIKHIGQLVPTFALNMDAKYGAGRDDHGADDGTSSAAGPLASRKTTDGHGISSGQYGDEVTLNATAVDDAIEPDAASSQVLAAKLNERDRPEANALIESARGEAARQRCKFRAQKADDEVQQGNDHSSSIANGEDVASKAVGDQTESQSTASQASEPTSLLPATKPSPQEITLTELRAQKAALLSSLRVQPAIQVLMEENADDDSEPTETDIMAAANNIVKEHIKLLHEYNELKDVGQGLMGLIADQRGVRIIEVQDEFGIDAND